MRASSLCQLFLVIVFALIACSSGGPSSTTGSSLPTAPDPAPPPPPPASTGVITVSVNTIGEQLDADGFMVVLDDEDVKALAPNDQQTLENVETGLHLVGIMGVASNCSVKHRRPAIGPETDPNPAPIEVVAGETQTLDFIVVCLPPGLGTLLVEISGRLVAMTATGGDQQPVGRVLGSQFHTNSDAERIVYTIFGGGGGADLHISDLSGLNTLNLTPTDDFAESNSALSPDGTKVVFNRLCCAPVFSDGDLMVVNSDGTGSMLLRDVGGQPSWSADGSMIVFSGDAAAISIMNADGSGVRQVPGAFGGGAQLSPDGTQVAFDNDARVHVANVDGTGLRTLTAVEAARSRLAWSPNGRWIAYTGSDLRGGGPLDIFDVFVVRADGSEPPIRVATGVRLVWVP